MINLNKILLSIKKKRFQFLVLNERNALDSVVVS